MAKKEVSESLAEVRPFRLLEGAVLEKGERNGEWVVSGVELEIDDSYMPVLSGPRASSVMLMKPGGGGGINVVCSCSSGSGSCDTVITIDGETGKKKLKCVRNTCTGGCGPEITIPANSGVLAPA